MADEVYFGGGAESSAQAGSLPHSIAMLLFNA
jgi:hypothetical protein